jgi:ABC-type phosphate transport system substrate-binding protein
MVRRRLAALLIALWMPTGITRPTFRAGLAGPDGARPVALAVIVQAGVPVTTLSVDGVRRIFLLRSRFWQGGVRVAPANLAPSSPLRDAFSRAVLGQSSRELADFWNDLYFHGTLPPPVVESEQAMLLYVARTPGAIGYVSRDALASQPPGVRVVLVVDAAVP